MANDRPSPTSLEGAFKQLGVTVYGVLLEPDAITMSNGGRVDYCSDGKLKFAVIKAWRVGQWRCTVLPTPVMIPVPDDGTPLAMPECGFNPGEVIKWTLPLNGKTIAFETSYGTVTELLEDFSTKGIDGGIDLSNPRFEGGKVCVDVHIWAEIEFLGQKVEFDERFTKCIDLLEHCVTVWEIGWAKLDVCIHLPNEIYGRLCVGKWGFEKCWDSPHLVIPLPSKCLPPCQPTDDCACK